MTNGELSALKSDLLRQIVEATAPQNPALQIDASKLRALIARVDRVDLMEGSLDRFDKIVREQSAELSMLRSKNDLLIGSENSSNAQWSRAAEALRKAQGEIAALLRLLNHLGRAHPLAPEDANSIEQFNARLGLKEDGYHA